MDSSGDDGSEVASEFSKPNELEETQFEDDEALLEEEAEPSLRELIDRASTNPSKSHGTYKGRGVVYLARIPPSMTSHQLRALLQPFGDVERIWIELPSNLKENRSISRQTAEKMARKMAREAWVEFSKAKKAYKAAKLLHMNPMGTGRWKHDLWNIKFLKDFTWTDLVTQHLHMKKMREQRLHRNVARAKQEATHFLDNLEKQAVKDKIDQKKLKKEAKKQQKSHSSSSTGLNSELLNKLLGN